MKTGREMKQHTY